MHTFCRPLPFSKMSKKSDAQKQILALNEFLELMPAYFLHVLAYLLVC